MSQALWYAKEMRSKFGFEVAWPPNSTVHVGDYGTLISPRRWWEFRGPQGAPFQRAGNIRDSPFNINFKISISAPMMENLVSESVSIESVEASANAGAGPSNIQAYVDVTFSDKKSMVYHGSDMVIESIARPDKVGEKLSARPEWTSGDEWVLVTSVHRTKKGIVVLLSNSGKASVKLGGSLDMTPGDLAAAAASVRVLSNRHCAAYYITDQPVTPLFQCSKLKVRAKMPLPRPTSQSATKVAKPSKEAGTAKPPPTPLAHAPTPDAKGALTGEAEMPGKTSNIAGKPMILFADAPLTGVDTEKDVKPYKKAELKNDGAEGPESSNEDDEALKDNEFAGNVTLVPLRHTFGFIRV